MARSNQSDERPKTAKVSQQDGNSNDEEQQELQRSIQLSIQQHQDSFKTLLLSTLSATTSVPELSYAPFSCDQQGSFYIFVSDLAGHSQNLRKHPACSLMFIANEADSRNLFARQRLTYECRAELVAASDSCYQPQLELLQQQCGDVVKLLRSLPDFRLFRLQPISGRYVIGFGKAYDIDPVSGRVNAVGPGA
ncbi:MAG: pyridoxamine 5'-phosphate oxidase family protein [Motiliproteus sp.]